MSKSYSLMILIAINSMFAIVVLSCSRRVNRKFYCTKESNVLRKKFHIPIIGDDMTCRDSTDFYFIYWAAKQKYPADTNILHAWKTITPGHSILSLESDAFRKRIDDTLLYQLNITSKIKKDSSMSIDAMLFYILENESKSLSIEFDNQYKNLSRSELDSIIQQWGLKL